MISIPGKFTHILHFKRVGIIATAFGKTQNSKGEIFAAVAFVFAKAPYANSPSLSSLSALSTSEKYQFRFPSVILCQLFGCNLGFAEGNILQKNCKCSFIFAGAVSRPDLTEDSCKMIVEMCTTLYTKQLKGENASDKQLCSTLHDYKLCLERSHNPCRGGSTYDTLLTVVSRLLNRLCSEHEESAAA